MKIQFIFGLNVRRIRMRHGWSQDYLSEKTGLHRTYISGIERGIRNPTLTIVLKIALALNVPIQDLFLIPNQEDCSID